MPLQAQQPTHVVQKGETLWSICEKHYGDPNLWPKLWQMNPFITNPHLLTPGDVITLIEKEPAKKPEAPVVARPAEKKPEKIIKPALGLDVAAMLNPATIGFISTDQAPAWGKIQSAETVRLILAKGDMVVVDFGQRKNVKTGDRFLVYQTSRPLTHPLTQEDFGYIVYPSATVVLKEPLKKQLFRAQIDYSYREVGVGDLVLPLQPVAPCIQPVSSEKKVTCCIVAARDEAQLIGNSSIVYLDKGVKHGVQRGNVLEVMKVEKYLDPDLNTEVTILDALKNISNEKTLADFYAKLSVNLAREFPLYERALGHILIIESRPETSTGIVYSAGEQFRAGVLVKTMSWAQPPESLAKFPSCPLE